MKKEKFEKTANYIVLFFSVYAILDILRIYFFLGERGLSFGDYDLNYLRVGALILDDENRNLKLFNPELFKTEKINLSLKKENEKDKVESAFSISWVF